MHKTFYNSPKSTTKSRLKCYSFRKYFIVSYHRKIQDFQATFSYFIHFPFEKPQKFPLHFVQSSSSEKEGRGRENVKQNLTREYPHSIFIVERSASEYKRKEWVLDIKGKQFFCDESIITKFWLVSLKIVCGCHHHFHQFVSKFYQQNS